MSRITKRASFRTLGYDWSLLDQVLDDIFQAINSVDPATPVDGDVTGQFNGRWIIYTSNAVANTDDTIRHRLGRVPKLLFNVELPVVTGGSPNSGRVYFGSVAPTSQQVTLRCTVASKRACVLLM